MFFFANMLQKNPHIWLLYLRHMLCLFVTSSTCTCAISTHPTLTTRHHISTASAFSVTSLIKCTLYVLIYMLFWSVCACLHWMCVYDAWLNGTRVGCGSAAANVVARRTTSTTMPTTSSQQTLSPNSSSLDGRRYIQRVTIVVVHPYIILMSNHMTTTIYFVCILLITMKISIISIQIYKYK